MNVTDCTVSPNTIGVGGSATLTVNLNQPAPPGGATVTIDVNSNGSIFTLLNSPQSIGVAQGATSGFFYLETQAADPTASQIIFTAHIGGGQQRSAQLNII